MSGFLSSSALAFVYVGVLLLGLALIAAAVISLLRSFTPGSQSQPAGGAHRGIGRATTYALGLGTAVFGAVGLLALLVFRVQPEASVLWSLGLGLAAAFAAEVILVYRPSHDQVAAQEIAIDADGRAARVVIAIPANGLGEVAYGDGEAAVHLGARSSTGQAIPRDAVVVIERVKNRVAVVRLVAGNAAEV